MMWNLGGARRGTRPEGVEKVFAKSLRGAPAVPRWAGNIDVGAMAGLGGGGGLQPGLEIFK